MADKTNSKWRAFLAMVPILLVNGIAIFGQTQFWHDHLPWPLIACVLFALALESVAVFLAYHAHLSQLSNDSSTRLRLASYAIGLVIGLMNGSHYLGPNGVITAAALGMGIMSAISPWLWAVHSRRQTRDQLKAMGLIESHALRLGISRWLFWPRQSFEVFRNAIWNGETTPTIAIKNWEARYDEYHWDNEDEVKSIDPIAPPQQLDTRPLQEALTTTARVRSKASANGAPQLLATDSKSDAVRTALAALGKDAATKEVSEWLKLHGRTDISTSHIRTVKTR